MNEMADLSKAFAFIMVLAVSISSLSAPVQSQSGFGNILKRGVRDALERARRDRQQTRQPQQTSSPKVLAAPPPRAPVDESSAAAECDRLAGHPDDPLRKTEGVPDEDVDLVEALQNCSEAVATAQGADSTRLMFQTGRVLWLAEEFDEAMPFLLDAAEAQEPAAMAYLGDAYATGLGGAEEDLETALTFYTQAAAAGFSPADAMADELAAQMTEVDIPAVQIAASTEQEVNECDRLAAHPADPRKIAPGVADAALDTPKAVAVCAAATAKFPGIARLDYQHGRSLYLAGRQDEALPVLVSAAEKGSAAAKAVIADAYLEGVGGVDQDIGAAYAFYQEAAVGGFKPAAANVAELKASFEPAAGATVSNKMTLSCEVMATIFSHDRTPTDYFITKPILYIDFGKGEAIVGGTIPKVEGKMLFSDNPYKLESSEDQIRFGSESLTEGSDSGTFIIDLNNGEVSYFQQFVYGSAFGFTINNSIELEGYCAPQQKK